jgi:hypothetical protein
VEGADVAVLCCPTLNYRNAEPPDGPAPTVVEVLDGRTADLPGWEECGFELLAHASAVQDWDDDDEIAAVHHPEVEDLARALTGCDHATVSNHIKRSPEQAARHQDLAPIRFVHSDFAAGYDALLRRAAHEARPNSALERHGLTAASVEEARRIVVLQFWRNLGPPRMDLPIAFCDARTVRPGDARPFPVRDYAGAGGPSFDALAIVAPDEPGRHRWYSFPDLQRDETVAFRTYDTDMVASGATYFTPHSAFRDPRVELGAPARSSIELRAVCLFA